MAPRTNSPRALSLHKQTPSSYLCWRNLVPALQEPAEPGGRKTGSYLCQEARGGLWGPTSVQYRFLEARSNGRSCLGNTVGSVPSGGWGWGGPCPAGGPGRKNKAQDDKQESDRPVSARQGLTCVKSPGQKRHNPRVSARRATAMRLPIGNVC